MAIFSWFSCNNAIFGAFEGPLKLLQNCLNFELCNNIPYGNFLAGGSWKFQKLVFFGTPYCTRPAVCEIAVFLGLYTGPALFNLLLVGYPHGQPFAKIVCTKHTVTCYLYFKLFTEVHKVMR